MSQTVGAYMECTIPHLFAQDLFVGQFGITTNGIIRLDTETGRVSRHSADFDDWADRILKDYDYETGWSVGKGWQEHNGPLPTGWRLLGRVPFVLGGEFVVDNMVPMAAREAMERLTSLYQQVRENVQDGQQITVRDWIT